jgi:hypothetical protein
MSFGFTIIYDTATILSSSDENTLKSLLPILHEFLQTHLQLELHPQKVILRKLSQGIDFVGYVLFAKYLPIRTKTKHRMEKRLRNAYVNFLQGKISLDTMDQRLQSFLGILSHAHQFTLSQALRNAYGVRTSKK